MSGTTRGGCWTIGELRGGKELKVEKLADGTVRVKLDRLGAFALLWVGESDRRLAAGPKAAGERK
jgi:hypothetical protein